MSIPQSFRRSNRSRGWQVALGLSMLALLLSGADFAAPGPARAESGITVVSSDVRVQFPVTVTFTLVAASPSRISSIGLEVNTPGKAYGAIPLDVHPSFTAGTDVRAVWNWDTPGPGYRLPPGTEISYQWTLNDDNGDTTQTAWQSVRYVDSRFPWQQQSGPGIHLYWYEGGGELGSRLMQAAQNGLGKLRREQGVDLRSDVSVYIYGSQQALRGAMLGSPTWIGGRAYPEFGTILLVIGQNELDQGNRSLVHELTHQLVYQQTFDPLLGSHVPLWLNEGLAVTSEGSTVAEFKGALAAAVRENRLPSFRTIDGAFPVDTKSSTLAYAQSESFVRYLLASYGADRMRSLLGALQRGNRIDASLSQAYGEELDPLQDAWRASLGAKPLTSSAPSALGSQSGGVARAGTRPAPGAAAATLLTGLGAVSVTMLVAIGLLIRWKRRPSVCD